MKMTAEPNFRVQVEVFRKGTSAMAKDALKTCTKRFLYVNNVLLSEQKHIDPDSYQDDRVLYEHVEFLEIVPSTTKYPIRLVSFQICRTHYKGI